MAFYTDLPPPTAAFRVFYQKRIVPGNSDQDRLLFILPAEAGEISYCSPRLTHVSRHRRSTPIERHGTDGGTPEPLSRCVSTETTSRREGDCVGLGTDLRRRSCGEGYYEASLGNGEHPCEWDFAFDALAEAGHPNTIPTLGALSRC